MEWRGGAVGRRGGWSGGDGQWRGADGGEGGWSGWWGGGEGGVEGMVDGRWGHGSGWEGCGGGDMMEFLTCGCMIHNATETVCEVGAMQAGSEGDGSDASIIMISSAFMPYKDSTVQLLQVISNCSPSKASMYHHLLDLGVNNYSTSEL